MTTYVDASVLLRIALGQPDCLAGWEQWDRRISSELLVVECMRTMDRIRMAAAMPPDEYAERVINARDLLATVDWIRIGPPILRRAAEPLPVVVRALDAIHLATMLSWRDNSGEDFTLASHDRQLARAARTYGIPIIGV